MTYSNDTAQHYAAGIIIEEDDKSVFRKRGAIRVVAPYIIFEVEGKAIEIPIAGCNITLGGTGNKQAYITHPKRKGTTLQVNDFAFFNDPDLASSPEMAPFRKQRSTHNFMLYGGILALTLAVTATFYMVFIERSFLVGKIVDAVPAHYDMKVGDIAFSPSAYDVITDEDIVNDLAIMTAPLIKAASKEPFEYNIHIVNDSTVNAYAVPGGHIIVNTGLIEKTRTAEELLGVIAHEMAHINERHSMKRIAHGVSTWLLISMLGGDPNHVIGLLTNQVDMLSGRSYSRHHEHEADERGFEYMYRAQINPQGLQGFFEILKEEESALTTNKVFGLLSTHPLTDDRVQALDELLLKYKFDAKNQISLTFYEAFKNKIAHATQKTDNNMNDEPNAQTP